MKYVIKCIPQDYVFPEYFFADDESFSDRISEIISEGYREIEVYAQIKFDATFSPNFEGWED